MTTRLMFETMHNNLDSMQELIATGADLNAQNAKGTTALMMAVIFEYRNAVELLLNANADPNLKNKYGNTALDLAKDRDNAKIANLISSKL